MKKILFVFLFLFFLKLQGQNNFPPKTIWKETETDYFRVIFPEENEQIAKEVAIFLDSVSRRISSVYRIRPNKINLILYGQTAISNAYAALAPRKMQWYLTPFTTPVYTLQPWTKVLTLHEYRHVSQHDFLKRGFTQLAWFLFGEYGHAAMINWAFPMWYFEGDAITSETQFSKSGRGRMPAFSLTTRAICFNYLHNSYENALFRSYSRYFPSHYELGYFMYTYFSRNYGDDFWYKVLDRTSQYSYWPFAFEKSIKKYTNISLRKHYQIMINELKQFWSPALQAASDTLFVKRINKPKKIWTNYASPYCVSEDTIICLKSGFDHNPTLVYLTVNGKEKFIREISDEKFHYSNGKIVWTELHFNPRYNEESYNDIVLYDLKTTKLTEITHNKRYFNAKLSTDATKIAAVSYTNLLKPVLNILSTNGEELLTYEFFDADNIFDIAWNDNDSILAISLNTNDGLSLILFDIATKKITTLIKPQWIKFDRLQFASNYLFFNYDYSGITNIYAYDLFENRIYRVTNSPYSSSQIAISPNLMKAYVTSYNHSGTDIYEIELNKSKWEPFEEVFAYNTSYLKDFHEVNFTTLENYIDLQKNNLLVTKYNPWNDFVNIHSWVPYANNQNIGLMLISNSIMNDVSQVFSIEGNYQINSFLGSYAINYSKFLPVLGLSVEGGRNGLSYDKSFLIFDSVVNWNTFNANFSVQIPLNFSRGIYNRGIEIDFETGLSKQWNYTDNSFNFIDSSEIKNDLSVFAGAQISGYILKYPSYRQLRPPFGISISAGFNYVPKLRSQYNKQIYAYSTIYLPGLSHNHSTKLFIGYDSKENLTKETYLLASPFVVFRSLPNLYLPKVIAFSVNYAFPLFYPDINIPYLLYIKRFKTNLFYENAFIYDVETNKWQPYANYGFELLTDFNLLRLAFFEFSLGVRFNFGVRQNAFQLVFMQPL